MTDAELKTFLSSTGGLDPLVTVGSLTDLTKETVTIGDGFRTRGSPPPLPSATFQNTIVTDVGIPTSRDIFGQPLTNA
jgi:hypothetical protein